MAISIWNLFLNKIRSKPHQQDIADPSPELARQFKRWQIRIMLGMMGGYAFFYCVRKNISMAIPGLQAEFGFSNTQTGMILTATSLIYGLGKFLNGILADRANPRWFMAVGLILSAIINLCFGMSSVFWAFLVLWLLNGWAQSMGWPPCATLLTSWYESKNLASWWGLWNASHQIGGAVILVAGGYLVSEYGWRSVFIVPAFLALLGALWIILLLRDRPQSMGFPSADQVQAFVDGQHNPSMPPPEDTTEKSSTEASLHQHENEIQEILQENPQENTQENTQENPQEAPESAKEQVYRYILSNPLIWLVSFGNLFVYIVRIGMLDWAPTFLSNARNLDIKQAGWVTAALEIAGILGGLLAGILADRLLKNRYSLVNAIYMAGLIVSLYILYAYPMQGITANAFMLSFIGFLVYGPQMLTAVSAADYAPRHCSATATGFNGLFGYIGASIAGVGTGWCVDHYGWNGGIMFYLIAALLGLSLFMIAHYLHEKRAQTSSAIH